MAAPSVASAEWISIGTDTDGSVWMMDPTTVSDSGGRVHVWVKIDASNNRRVKYRESKNLYSSICSSKKIKLLSFAEYDSYGRLINSQSYSDSTYSDYGYSYVIPESTGATVLEISCAVSRARAQ